MDEILKPGTNTGVIIDVRPTDFVAGGESGAVREILSSCGDYSDFLPDDETQKRFLIDIFGCVSFSAANSLEIIFNFKIAKGLISPEAVQFLKDYGYIDPASGKINFSDRAIAKGSGTSRSGNSLGNVGDWIRGIKDSSGNIIRGGLVPERTWPWPASMTEQMTADQKWNLYYSELPQEVIDLGVEFLKHFDISYEWVVIDGLTKDHSAAIKTALQYGPVQVATLTGSGWNTDQEISAIGCGTSHATTIYGTKEPAEPWKDLDHYNPYCKKLAWDFCIPYAFQYHVVEHKEPAEPDPRGYIFKKPLTAGDPESPEVKMLQAALQYVKDPSGKAYMKAGVFGPYGPQTKASLARFQVDNGIPGDFGVHFGPKTRAAMNKKLQQ